AHTRTTHAASFARKGQTKLGRTPRTLKTNKATREVAAADKGVELVSDECGHARMPLVLHARHKDGQPLAHDRQRVAGLGLPWCVGSRLGGRAHTGPALRGACPTAVSIVSRTCEPERSLDVPPTGQPASGRDVPDQPGSFDARTTTIRRP